MGVLGRTRKRYGVPRWSGSTTIYKCLDAPGPCRFPALTSLCFIRRRTGRPGPSRNRKVKAWQGSRAPRHGPAIRMPGISTRPCGQAGSTEETPRRRTSYVVSLAVAMGPCRSPALSGVPGGFQTGEVSEILLLRRIATRSQALRTAGDRRPWPGKECWILYSVRTWYLVRRFRSLIPGPVQGERLGRWVVFSEDHAAGLHRAFGQSPREQDRPAAQCNVDLISEWVPCALPRLKTVR